MANEKLLILARKLKALADKGIDGEKQNAIKMLENFMSKHDIKPEDIEDDIKKERCFKVEDRQYIFWQQIVASVIGQDFSVYFDRRQKYSKKKNKYVKLTDIEYAEIQIRFDFFWTAYEKDMKIFYKAFIQKNHLYSKSTGENEDVDNDKDLTPEEMAELFRMAQIMGGLDRHSFHKRLGNV